LFIVIVIFGVLVALAIPQVSRFVASSNIKISKEGEYTIYIQQGGLQEEIGTINLGEVVIQYPRIMLKNKSDVITVSITPTNNAPTITSLSSGSTPISGNYTMSSKLINLYPVMDAQLKTANFDISNQGNGIRAISNDGAVWKWVVSPKTIGKQFLIAELDVPIQLAGFEAQDGKAVYINQFTINIKAPFDWYTFLTEVGIVVAVSWSLFSFWRYFCGRRKRRANIKKV